MSVIWIFWLIKIFSLITLLSFVTGSEEIDTCIECLNRKCSRINVTFKAFDRSFGIELLKKKDVFFYVGFNEEIHTKNECYFLRNGKYPTITLSACDGILNGIFIENNQSFEIKFNESNRSHTIDQLPGINQRAVEVYNYVKCGVNSETNVSLDYDGRGLKGFPKMYLPIVVVVDHSNYIRFKKKKKEVHQAVKKYFKACSAILKQINIELSITGIVIWEKKDEIIITKSGDETLNNFLNWHNEVLAKKFPNCFKIAHLLLNVPKFDMAGRAFVGSACSLDHAISLTWTKYTNYDNVQYTAHELLHNLGVSHDHNGCKCKKDPICIMALGNKGLGKRLSRCSLIELTKVIKSGELDCLKSKGPKCMNKG